MCGFTGFCSLGKNFPQDPIKLLTNMHEKITHRGPDDFGTWISEQHNIGIANRRLAIIDLSSAGKQPMIDKEQTVVISYNGEIYNHPKLRQELISLGYNFFSNCDTESLLYAYKEWGIDCLKHIEGMFAGVIFDRHKNELFIFRDRIGIKPAYFSIQNNMLSFASEIKALWALDWNKKNISQQALYHYLTFMVTPAPYTIFEQVYKLPAGFYMKLDTNRKISFHEWYTPLKTISQAEQKDFMREDFCVENIKKLLEESVHQQMASDVPFGTFLSGGIDSSLNVALMSKFIGKVKTFTVAFSDGPEHNELKWARLVAKHFDTDHHEIIISEKEAFEFYKNMTYFLDEPLADCVCIPFYYVAKLARESGVTVAQIGEGADELFFGYDTYARYHNFHKKIWNPSQKIIPTIARRAISNLAAQIAPTKLGRLEIIDNWARDRNLFWTGSIAFNEHQKQKILQEPIFTPSKLTQNMHDPIIEKIYPGLKQEFDSYAIVNYHLNNIKKHDAHASFSQQMLYLELKQRLPELLLMRADKMTMATSIEGRVPFLDHKLVEFMMNVPINLKFKNNITKYLLKKAAIGILPDEIINRKKIGFAAPTQRWFSSGKYFSEYFKQASYNSGQNFTPVAQNMHKYLSESEASLAVKKWVLQNIWSLT
ncbi:MAG: asparagine synthase (glutamine-hydrolyzing) [bacterium]